MRMPFMSPEGDVQYATLIVQVFPDMTNDDVLTAIYDAINAFVLSIPSTSDRLLGYEPVYDDLGGYEYEIGGFNPGDVF